MPATLSDAIAARCAPCPPGARPAALPEPPRARRPRAALAGALAPPASRAPSGLVTLASRRRSPPPPTRRRGRAGRPRGPAARPVEVAATYDARAADRDHGPVTALPHHEFGAFRRLHLSPAAGRASGTTTGRCTVPVAGPLTDADLDRIRGEAARPPRPAARARRHRHPEDLSAPGLVRATLAAAARRCPTPPWSPSRWPSHGDADRDHELGQRVVAAYAPGDVLGVTGEGELPDASPRSSTRTSRAPTSVASCVFFTGLSGSGKSTLARALHDLILEDGRRTVTSLDGDVVRRNLSAGLTFSKEDRETNIRRIGWVAAEIARHRGIAICSPIAPFDATRKQVRAMVEDAGGEFVLVHVATPLEECERRDRKGLYAKARRGEIPEFTGISSPYEEPEDADRPRRHHRPHHRGRPRRRARRPRTTLATSATGCRARPPTEGAP